METLKGYFPYRCKGYSKGRHNQKNKFEKRQITHYILYLKFSPKVYLEKRKMGTRLCIDLGKNVKIKGWLTGTRVSQGLMIQINGGAM